MTLPPEQAVYVATYLVGAPDLARRNHPVSADVAQGRILRSVLMKPEIAERVPALLAQLETLAAEAG
jgi:hypothetical protein